MVPTSFKEPTEFITNIDENVTFELWGVSPNLVLNIIKSLPAKNSLDLLGISTNLLKFVAYQIMVPLAHIFQLSIEQGIFPEKLKKSRVVPIYKTGEKSNIDNYRPISLVASISKILEKIVSTQLTNFLQINKLISPWQFGFLRNLSTEHTLLHVTNYIGNAINKGDYCIGIFLT